PARLNTLAGLLLHTVVAQRVEALTLRDKAAVERVDGQPTGHAHDLGGMALPVGLGRHEPRLISGSAPLALPGLGTDAMKVKLPVIMELGDAHHAGDRRAAAVAQTDRTQVQREARFPALRKHACRQPLPHDRAEVARLVCHVGSVTALY